MILSKSEIQTAIAQAQAAFPHFSEWEYHNAVDEYYFGFSLWGEYMPHPDVLMPRRFYITLDTYDDQWAGHLTIGQPCYLWSSADMGDAHLVDSDDCASLENAITSLKAEMGKLFTALSLT